MLSSHRVTAGLRSLVLLIGLALAAILAAPSARADVGRDSNTPTGWFFYDGITVADINNLVSNSNQRLVTLKRKSNGTFNVTTVTNSGEYAKVWWWYHNIDAGQVSSFLSANNGRLISIDAFDNGAGSTRFNVVMIRNTGADFKTWWWYWGGTVAATSTLLDANNGRLVDMHQYQIGGVTRLAVIMISNTGADAKEWYWYVNVDPATVSAQLSARSQRLVDLQVVDDNPFRLNAIMERRSGQGWWWFYGVSAADLANFPAQYASRVFDWQSYSTASGTRYALLMLDNANTLTLQTRNQLLASDGFSGGYMKEVGGSVLASVQPDRVFEPASMLKILHTTYAMDRCAAGTDNLNTQILVPDTCNNNECPDNTPICNPFNESLSEIIRETMEESDNNRTKVLHDRYGRATLNAYASFLGMSNTQINHNIGCGSPPNTLTLRDNGTIYERVADGSLFAQSWQDTLYGLMIDSVGNAGSFNTNINTEAAATSLTSNELAEFKSLCYMATKGGSYGVATGQHRTLGGWMRLPFKNGAGTIFFREYVVSTFVNDASNGTTAGNASSNAWWTMARDRIRAALDSWDDACTPPNVISNPGNATRAAGQSVNFSVGSTGTNPRTFRWFRGATALSNGAGPGGSTISGATASTLTISNLSEADEGQYRCVVSNGCGTDTSAFASLTITCPADFNGDGNLDPDDLGDMINCYFTLPPCRQADYNADGNIDPDDLGDFINAYFAGCP
ncbi:MAG: serine hydrolase [Phycisphaerales bacterium]